MYFEIMWLHIPSRYLYPSSRYWDGYYFFYRSPVLVKRTSESILLPVILLANISILA